MLCYFMSCSCLQNSNGNLDLLNCEYNQSLVKATLSKLYQQFKDGCFENEINNIPNSFKYYKLQYVKSIIKNINENQKMTDTQFTKLINEQNNTNNNPLTNNDYITNMSYCNNIENDFEELFDKKNKCKTSICTRYIVKHIFFLVTTNEKIKECEYIDFRDFLIALTKLILINYYKNITKKYSLSTNNIYKNSEIIRFANIDVATNYRLRARTIFFKNFTVVV